MPAAPVLSLVPDRGAGLADVTLDARVWATASRALLDDLGLPSDARVLVAEDVLSAGPSLAPAAFDLVHARFQLCRHGRAAEQLAAFRRLVAPGGTLLVVHHADVDRAQSLAHGFDVEDYVSHEDVAAALGDGWQVELDERRARVVPASGGGGHHHHDLVLRARRSG